MPADTYKVADCHHEMNELLILIAEAGDYGEPDEWEDWASHCFVSDESWIWDFLPDQSDRQKLSDKLGFPISKHDYVVSVAARMRELKNHVSRIN